MPISSLSAAIARLKASSASQSNASLILEHDKKLMGRRISEEHRKKFIDRLRWWAEELGELGFREAEWSITTDTGKKNKEGKPIMETEKRELQKLYEKLTARDDIQVGTINHYITELRQFYKWLEGDDEELPKKVRKLKPLPYQPALVSENGETSIRISTPDEIERMIKIAKTPRDKCLVALSYDCGGRLGEIMSLEMSHVKSDPPFFKIYLHGDKTWERARVGKRWVSVYFAVPYINDFLKSHSFKLGTDKKPFWINSGKYGGTKNAKLSQSGFKTIFDRIKENAGIEGKRFHDLRHTKCTHLLRMNMPEMKVKKFLGHSPNSKQLGRYSHLVSEDIDEELSRMYGLEFTRKTHDDIPIPIKCSVCNEVNEAGSETCKKCFCPLSAKAITNAATREKYWKQKYEKNSATIQQQLEAVLKANAATQARVDRMEGGRWGRIETKVKKVKKG